MCQLDALTGLCWFILASLKAFGASSDKLGLRPGPSGLSHSLWQLLLLPHRANLIQVRACSSFPSS